MKHNTLLIRSAAIALYSTVALPLYADSFTASVNRASIGVGERIEVSFTIDGAGARNFTPPDFGTLRVLSGPNQQQSVQMTNGTMKQEIRLSYIVQATQEGTTAIGPAEITIGQKRYKSSPINIAVGKAAARNTDEGAAGSLEEKIRRDVMIKAVVSKQKVRRGEFLSVTWKLMTRAELTKFEIARRPSLDGFWTEELAEVSSVTLQDEVINGERWRTAVLKRTALFPQRDGKLTIDPMEAKVGVRIAMQGGRNPFDAFFGRYKDEEILISSPAITITADPLPKSPASFAGFVGKLAAERRLDKDSVAIGEPITIRTTLRGAGNLGLLEPARVDLPTTFETWEPKKTPKIAKSENGISGSVEWEQVVIPRASGTYKIPAYTITYFDPAGGSYKDAAIPERTIIVGNGAFAGDTSAVAALRKQRFDTLSDDIRWFASYDGTLTKPGEPLWGSPLFWTLVTSPWALTLLLPVLAKRRREQLGTADGRRKTALAELDKAIDNLKKYPHDEKASAAVATACQNIMSLLSGIQKAHLTAEAFTATLGSAQAETFAKTVSELEFIRFAPGGKDHIHTLAESLRSQAQELCSSVA